ncbi:hypothetical protein EPUS_03274 [Endocarpon pusillum Z07020]|uniref:60S ribosomal protein L36 n=1 Tax=Endocarpon pusillum (strain Z07020 / HMAS-L-300199) TaxID=1263415 RepID=U1HL40_ENDPU|nr:uncharacterized protein EPUS_03274 [Endocarpon pusillum Z07020]ERF70995.1 hypothetical protein EPUS_03274 [Endocarpon pusillum Z07020]
MAILTSEHQHNTHPLLVKIMKLLSVPPDPDLYQRLSDDRVGLHKLIRLEEEFGEDDAGKAALWPNLKEVKLHKNHLTLLARGLRQEQLTLEYRLLHAMIAEGSKEYHSNEWSRSENLENQVRSTHTTVLPVNGRSSRNWRVDEAFSVGPKSTIDELQTIPSNFIREARACSWQQSRRLRGILMRLVGHRDEVLAWETAEVAHDILAPRAALEFPRTLENQFTPPSIEELTTDSHIDTSTKSIEDNSKMAKEVKARSNVIQGLDKGHPTTALERKLRISRTKGHLSKRTAFVREIVKEVAGLAPYERRVIELLRNGKDKRARKLAKKRLGTFGRAKRKVDELQGVIAESRRTGGH